MKTNDKIPTVKQNKGESRKDYLLRVVLAYLEAHPIQEYQVHYDEADCDGGCLAQDITNELYG